MKTLSVHNRLTLPVIGLGTWTMGGSNQPDPTSEARSLLALQSAFDTGYTLIDTAEMYANGNAEKLVGQAIRGRNRQDLFITSKVHPRNLRAPDLGGALDASLRRLGVDYLDLYLIHWPSGSIPLGESFAALNRAVRNGKVRWLGVSNFDLTELKTAQRLSETPILTNQVPYSLETRRYVQNGVIPYCQEQGIVVTAYSPVEEGRLKANHALERIAQHRGITRFQAALAWLVSQPLVITIPMSHNPDHLRENFAAGDLTLSPEEMAALG
jgi:diketogulonate reductase-like aldo/keto reductase